MNGKNYRAAAEALLRRVEEQCDALNDSGDLDLDNRRAGGVLTLTFADGGEIVINLQPPLEEVWLADLAGGSHYALKGDEWRDTKTGGLFWEALSEKISAHAEKSITLNA